jgi:plastocyanin
VNSARTSGRFAVLAVALCLATGPLAAVTPGVDIAVPRVSMVTADGATLRFLPSRTTVEQSDYVQWNWNSGAHTTTSGAPCTASGLWTASLASTTPSFMRQFTDLPATYAYFCSPHCTFGMTGQIVVTLDIQVTVTDASGAVQLNWTGGAAPYGVFRSDNPGFTGQNTVVLTPQAGTQTASFLDAGAGVPPVGTAFFYLVMDQ